MCLHSHQFEVDGVFIADSDSDAMHSVADTKYLSLVRQLNCCISPQSR